MTESIATGATTNFIIVTTEQMEALNALLFYLIRQAHTHQMPDPTIYRPEAGEMHDLLAKWQGGR